MKTVFTYTRDFEEFYTWFEGEDYYLLKNDNDDILNILYKDQVVDGAYMQRMKEDYEQDEFLEVVCACDDKDFCGDCEICEQHKDGVWQIQCMEYEPGEEKAKEFFESEKGKHFHYVCYECFRIIAEGGFK